jgi:ribosomal protein L35AE/L33A
MVMNDNEQKLHKYMVKAEECTSRKKAQKVLKKVAKVTKKIQEDMPDPEA